MLGAGASTASGFKAGDWIDLAQTLFIALGGLWAFYLYLTSRRGQTAVGIQPTLRLAPGSISGETILLVGIRISNVSRALFRNEEAKATLMDASQRAPDGTVLLLPFAEQDPLLPVCGELTEDADEIAAGRTLYFPPTQTILLEPGESVDCDLAFPLSSERLKLLAMKIRISGFQARPIRA